MDQEVQQCEIDAWLGDALRQMTPSQHEEFSVRVRAEDPVSDEWDNGEAWNAILRDILNEPMEIGKAPLPAEDETLDYNLIITRTVIYSDCAISGAAFTRMATECGFSRDPGETLGVFLRRIERAGHGWVTLLANMADGLVHRSGIPQYTLEWDIAGE